MLGHALGSAWNALLTTKVPVSNNISLTKRCHIADNFIDFGEGKPGDDAFASRVLHPRIINIKTCTGDCSCKDGLCHAEGTGIDITHHARFKGLLGCVIKYIIILKLINFLI